MKGGLRVYLTLLSLTTCQPYGLIQFVALGVLPLATLALPAHRATRAYKKVGLKGIHSIVLHLEARVGIEPA